MRRTDVIVLRSGRERRNAIWSDSRRRYDAGLGIRSVDDLYAAMEFFEAREGRLIGFRWKDWLDFKSCPPNTQVTMLDQNLGTGNGTQTQFQLRKSYVSGTATIWRDIKKPVDGTVVVAVNGVQATVTVNHTTGMVTFATPPPNGHTVTAGFEFDVPVRFDQDEFMVNLEHFQLGEVPNLKVIEIFV
jgi:uncharacterized protein (TIGR02217 family)